MNIEIHPICDKIFHLAECPLWNVREKALYWTDILNGEIWRYDAQTGESALFWSGRMQTGGMAFTTEGNLVICSDQGVFILENSKGRSILHQIYSLPFEKNERFNDVTTDPAGRLIAGTKKENLKDGILYSFERIKSPQVLLEGIGISNGMTFSPDHKYFYHTDSLAGTIRRYEYDIRSGSISNPETWYHTSGTDAGSPDGITMDSEGYIWVAFWGASCIRRISPSGKVMAEFAVPAVQPSSVMFGGPALDTLFITSACEGGADILHGLDKSGHFLGGLVYALNVNIKGREEWPAGF